MHMVIRALVYAKTKQEALSKAESIFDNLSGDGKSFDYYTMFDDDTSEVSGKGRYGNIPAALKVPTKAAMAMIQEGMDATKREFRRNIDKVRQALATYTDDEIFEEEKRDCTTNSDITMARYYMYSVGKYDGSSYWLYNNDGSAIRTTKELRDALAKYASYYDQPGNTNPYKDLQVWVVPADVHF
jgi:hypothetical protein